MKKFLTIAALAVLITISPVNPIESSDAVAQVGSNTPFGGGMPRLTHTETLCQYLQGEAGDALIEANQCYDDCHAAGSDGYMECITVCSGLMDDFSAAQAMYRKICL